MKLANSPITQHRFHQHTFYLKRDDQLHSHFCGNKARKFMQLLEMLLPEVTTLVSYGSAQSNSMLSLAALAKIRGWKFEFYVDRIPHWLKATPRGNYRAALELGANIISVSEKLKDSSPDKQTADKQNVDGQTVDRQTTDLTASPSLTPEQYIKQVRTLSPSCFFVPEGGRFQMAEYGIKQLAREIVDWTRFEADKEFVVALPAGTGSTALYLQKHLQPHGIEVLTCACVGGNEYLKQQFLELEPDTHPTVISSDRKHHFGKLYQQDYQTWQALLEQTDIEFDLLYDPLMWQCLLPWLDNHPDKTLLYVHQGGLIGNETMLARYQRKFDD